MTETPTPIPPVFFDPTRKRAVYLNRLITVGSVVVLSVLIIFLISVLAVPLRHGALLSLPRFTADVALHDAFRKTEAPVVAQPRRTRHGRRRLKEMSPVLPAAIPGKAKGVVAGFYVSWNQVSLVSLRRHAGEITHLFPGWLHLQKDGESITSTSDDPADRAALTIAREHHLAIVPVLDNFDNQKNSFGDSRVHNLLISPQKRAALIAHIRSFLDKHHFQGINLDLETDSDADRALVTVFTREVSTALHPAGYLVTQDVQTGSVAASAQIARSCDFIIPMIYDQHDAGDTPGAIAPEGWAKEQLDALLNQVPASKIVLALGNYAYNWRKGKAGAASSTFGEAMATARESHDKEDGIVRLDPATRNPYFTYTEGKTEHIVWILDAVTAYNLERHARARGVDGRALWYIGSEDPSLWSFFGRNAPLNRPSLLTDVRYGFEIDFEGEGEILDVSAMPQAGTRKIHVAPDGRIDSERFTAYPTACILRRSGRVRKEIALTFDDGPDPKWTPMVLDALHNAQIPGTFFVIGSLAQQRPDLLRREWENGCDIGNHSFYHPNLSQVSAVRTRLELDATQRAIQSAIGRSTPLFRPPYGIDQEPSTTEEVLPVVEAQKLGYITVAEGIDPRDWQTGIHHLKAAQIADNIVRLAQTGGRNIVLLHDGGGDRTETVAAIGLAVERLKADGFRFVTVSTLLGHSRATLFPVVTGNDRFFSLVDREVFRATTLGGQILGFVFFFSLIAGTVRILFIGTLAVRHAQIEREREKLFPVAATAVASSLPTVSVVIAAYNEEKVIARTIYALLAGNYPGMEVIVVDDGSRDDTSGVVRREFGAEPRVRLLCKANGGKASALNYGIEEATGTVLVGLDADTLFAPDTVHRLAGHFADPTVGAVAGNIQVGNRRNLLTRWQAVEYTTSQNFDRRAYDLLNGIPVVPGAVGAWRASALRAAGGYATDTLAEDADLTWRVRRDGWRILSDSSALAYTEAPEKWRDLLKQRFRWTFGTFQTLWKHADLLFRPSYGAFGCVVVPSLWIFQVLLPLAAPAADIGMIAAALSGNLGAALGYYLFFLLLEVGAAGLAYSLDPDARRRSGDLKWILLQRFVYRQVLFIVYVRALATALRGSRTGWGKLERRGTATVPLLPLGRPRRQSHPKNLSEGSLLPAATFYGLLREGMGIIAGAGGRGGTDRGLPDIAHSRTVQRPR